MRYVNFPNTDLEVSVVGMGCWPIIGGPTWGPQDPAGARDAIHACLDLGVTYFDTAELYGAGESESLLGQVLRKHQDEVVIASKVIPEHAEPTRLRQSCEDSLRALKRDWIDVYHVHWPVRDVPLADVVETLKALKKEGKIREMAVSNFGAGDLQDFVDAGGDVPVNQLPYSLLFRAIEYEVLPACISAESAVVCYGPLQQGLLTGKWNTADEMPAGRTRSRLFSGERANSRHGEAGHEALLFDTLDRIRQIVADCGQPMHQVSLAWLLAQDGVAAVIPGMRNRSQVEDAVRGADLVEGGVIQALTEVTDELRDALGADPDLWESQENSRYR